MRNTIRSAAIGALNTTLLYIALEIENGSDRLTGDQVVALMLPFAIVSAVLTELVTAVFRARP